MCRSQGVGIAEANNPAQATVISATRTWTDVNGNYIPDCTIRNLAANGECGQVSNNRFGTVNFTRRYSQDGGCSTFTICSMQARFSAWTPRTARPGCGRRTSWARGCSSSAPSWTSEAGNSDYWT